MYRPYYWLVPVLCTCIKCIMNPYVQNKFSERMRSISELEKTKTELSLALVELDKLG